MSHGIPSWMRLHLPAVVLFILAAVLRFDRLWLLDFNWDEIMLAGRALSFIRGEFIPLTSGPSSAGVAFPAGFTYLIAIPLSIWSHPLAGSVLIALCGTLAVIGCYYLGCRHFGREVGLIAGFLYAVNPWAISYTRHIWQPESVQLFVVLFFLALYGFMAIGSAVALALSIIGLAFLPQLHFETVVLLPVWLVGVLIARRRLPWRAVILGMVAGLLLYVPYLYGEAETGWPNLRALFAQPVAGSHVDLAALSAIRELVADFSHFLPDDLAGAGALDGLRLWLLRWGGAWLCLIGLIATLWQSIAGNPSRRKAHWLLVTWVAAPILFTLRHWLELFPSYYITLFPVFALASGVGVVSLRRMVGRAYRLAGAHGRMSRMVGGVPFGSRGGAATLAVVSWLVVLGVGYAQAYAWRSYYDDVERGNRERYGHAIPLVYTTALAEYLDAAGFDQLMVDEGERSYLPQALGVLMQRHPKIIRYDGSRSLPLPTAGGIYVVSEHGTPSASLLARVAAGARIRQITELGRPLYSVYSLPSGFGGRLLKDEFKPTDLRFENAERVLGVQIPAVARAGAKTDLALFWRVERQPTGLEHYTLFAHLVDGRSNQIAAAQDYDHQPSTIALGGDWISWLSVAVPDDVQFGPVWLDYGIFVPPGITPVQVRGSDDRPVGTQVHLGPLKMEPAGTEAPSPQHRRSARFGDAISLLGYDLTRAGRRDVQIRLYWRADGRPAEDYQSFVHIVDSSGRLVAQEDSTPGDVPTSLWEEGDSVVDTRTVHLPADLAPDRYRIQVGLYSLSDSTRLNVVGEPRSVVDQALVLGRRALP